MVTIYLPSAGNAVTSIEFEVYSHIRKASFRLIDRACRSKGEGQSLLGEKSIGFNLIYASYGGLSPDDSIRDGLDFIRLLRQ